MKATERPALEAGQRGALAPPTVLAPLAPLVALREVIAAAQDLSALATAANAIPRIAAELLAEGSAAAVEVGEITRLISALNDQVSERVVHAVAAEMGMDMRRACWLVFGSQARGEQTLLTDQDNGLVFAAAGDDDARAQRPAWMAFGQRVNEALARCGYALCDGSVMAGQPLCCLSTDEWRRRFEHWMAHGDGNDLFASRIYFDLRALTGDVALARPLLDLLRSPAAAVPRFAKQMADIVLGKRVPLNWLGQVVTSAHGGEAMFDLKLSGTNFFVDAGRLWALAHCLDEVGTVPRLRAAGAALHVPDQEVSSWVAGFQALQGLRLRMQRARIGSAEAQERTWVRWRDLDTEARGVITQALRAARLVQQRIELDYCR